MTNKGYRLKNGKVGKLSLAFRGIPIHEVQSPEIRRGLKVSPSAERGGLKE